MDEHIQKRTTLVLVSLHMPVSGSISLRAHVRSSWAGRGTSHNQMDAQHQGSMRYAFQFGFSCFACS